MVGADLEGLSLAHDEADLGGLIVLQQLHGAHATLLPLVPVLVEAVQLRLPAATPTVSDQNLGKSDRSGSRGKQSATETHMSRSTSSSSSPVVTATSSSLMMGATWAPVSSSSAGRCSAGSAMARGSEVGLLVCYRSLRVAAAAEMREMTIKPGEAEEFFFYFDFLNKYLRNESKQKVFFKYVHFSRASRPTRLMKKYVSKFDVTYF
jgi:hypothetical protein